ncbi:MAG: DUF354 domain-containing protein [Phocaeicola sp.]
MKTCINKSNTKRVLIYLGHPAHFHLFKQVILNLLKSGDEVAILIKKKDILEELLKQAGFSYHNILEEGRSDSRIGILWGTLKRAWRLYRYAKKYKPSLLIGTSVENAWIGKILGIAVINTNEDDAAVVPLYTKLSYPWSSVILTPYCCDSGKWNDKTIKYHSYHELAYLHPHHFVPNRTILTHYFKTEEPYFILRFAKLTAHHDQGVKGIDSQIAKRLIAMLKPYGRVYITSERTLESDLEPFRININPLHMHDIMAFASIYIGDSQTMAAEAGVLGVPFVRFNDFVGRIGYLNELEKKYKLGDGIRTTEPEKLYSIIDSLLKLADRSTIYQKRRLEMLQDKIDYAQFLTWFIKAYPSSKEIMEREPTYANRFK